MRLYCIVVVSLTVVTYWTAGSPVDLTTTEKYEDLPHCYEGMDSSVYQCVVPNKDEYTLCNVEAPIRCRCSEGLVCKRDSVTEQQCVFQCVIENPLVRGMKSKFEWDENMERIYK